ncbi:2-phospho-L-lactate guanylyltransferase [Gordonia sp. CPCC 206044]|uniref:2-phospho-L-lactate guanylyltransferase n=1 Tax=Gordonia sp. CPCC 206044 TaxID=3140793 RepID=UPI003AF332F4
MDSTSHPGPDGVYADDVTRMRVVGEPATAETAAVMAVKRLDDAKSRLAASRGPAHHAGHRGLVLAMMLDTVEAVSSAGIGRIVVVSPDADVLAAARSAGAVGAQEIVAADDASPADRLNLAFTHATAQVRAQWPSTTRVLLIQADLPAATSQSLTSVIDASRGHTEALLTDRDATGTTILVRDVAVAHPPRFGPDSATAHRLAGAVELDPGHRHWADLRTDVDTAADLEAARLLGLGRHTAASLGLRQAESMRTTPDAS